MKCEWAYLAEDQKMSIIVEPQLRNKVLFIRGFGGLAEILCQMANLLKFKVIVQTSNDEKERFPDAEKIITDEIEIGSVNLPIDFFTCYSSP